MKKAKTKERSSDKSGANQLKELVKKPPKNPVVKAKAKVGRGWKLPAVGEYWRQTVQFLQEAWIELKKVTWPGQKETMGATAIVLILVFLVSFYLGLVDFSLSRLIKYLVG